jgi:hypothetical protein
MDYCAQSTDLPEPEMGSCQGYEIAASKSGGAVYTRALACPPVVRIGSYSLPLSSSLLSGAREQGANKPRSALCALRSLRCSAQQHTQLDASSSITWSIEQPPPASVLEEADEEENLPVATSHASASPARIVPGWEFLRYQDVL